VDFVRPAAEKEEHLPRLPASFRLSEAAPLDPEVRDRALAARLDRLKQEQALLQMLLGQPGEGGKNGGFGDTFVDRT
jgi:hypothetical protein